MDTIFLIIGGAVILFLQLFLAMKLFKARSRAKTESENDPVVTEAKDAFAQRIIDESQKK